MFGTCQKAGDVIQYVCENNMIMYTPPRQSLAGVLFLGWFKYSFHHFFLKLVNTC